MTPGRTVMLALLLAACGPSGDDYEQKAREALERDEYDAIELTELPGERGVHLLAERSCTFCPSGRWLVPELVDGQAFSPGEAIRELQPVVVPEPSTCLLVATGLLGAGLARRRG